MKRQVAVLLLLGLFSSLSVVEAQEPEKLAENVEKPVQTEQQSDPTQPAEPLAPPFDAGQPEPEPASQAQGLIYIQPGTGSQSTSRPMWALLNNPDLQETAVREAAKQHLKADPGDLKQIVFNYHPSGDNALMTAYSYDDRLQAKWVLESLRDQVAKRLVELDKPIELELRRREHQERINEMTVAMAAQRSQLGKLAYNRGGIVDLALAGQQRLSLMTEIQTLAVDLKGLKARNAILEKQITDLVVKAIDEDSAKVIDELGKVIEAKKRQVDFLNDVNKKAGGTVSNSDIERARGHVAEAEAELAKFRREAAAGNSQRASELRSRLDDTLIEIAESEAKLGELELRYEAAQQFDEARLSIELNEQDLRRSRQQLDEMSAELRRYIPPRVILIRTK